MSNRASYNEAFAPRDGIMPYQSLGGGRVFAVAPCLGPTGGRLLDWSPYKNHGTIANADLATVMPTSQGRYCFSPDGTNDYIDFGTEVNIYGLAIFAGSFWVYKTSNTAAWVLNRYNTSAAGGIVGDLFGLAQGTSIPKINASFTNTTAANYIDYNSGDVITLNQWHHVSISVNLTTQTATATLNGAAVTMTPTVVGTPPAVFKAKTSTTWTSSRIIGSGGGSIYSLFQADDIALYNRALTLQESKTLATRRGIAYELAPRRRSSTASGNRRRRMLIGAN